ncbi:TRAP transporter small permease subunit [Pusillimonas sp. TS35]|nr:TRAP transporter small permease subunit [Pusillimonas sp. TS35]
MKFLLSASRVLDYINTKVGQAVIWLTLVVVVVSAGNAIIRKVFSVSSNAWLELQWYLFGALFLLAAGYTYLRNEHVRVDVLAQRLSRRTQIKIEIFGIIFFLLPACCLIFWLSLPFFYESFVLHELSSNTGGLIRWPVKLLIPVGFLLLILSALSHLIKCIGYLRGLCPDPMLRGDGKSAEEELAEEIRQQAAAIRQDVDTPAVPIQQGHQPSHDQSQGEGR